MAIDFKKIIKGIFIKEESDPSKGLKFTVDPAAGTNTTTTIIAEQAVDVLLSLPGETSELLGDVANQDIQNKTIDADLNTISNIDDADIKVGAAIDAAKIANGSVSNAEYQYLANVTSDIQTQLNTGGSNLTDHLNDTSDAHDASAISNVPSGNLAATDQQAANNELQSDIDTRLLKAGDTMSGNLNMGSNLITSLATPVSGTDATNKNYVDGIAAGLDPKESVRVATTASIGGSYATTPSNGQFTGAATSVDGVALSVSDRVLIKDQADAKQNGIYVYSAAGEFTRSADMDGSPASEVSGGNFVFVAEGTTQSASGYVLIANGTLTLNTDNLVFTQFSGGANSANKTLSNLDSPTAINQSLLPGTDNTINIGSAAKRYTTGYVQELRDASSVLAQSITARTLYDSSGNASLTYSGASSISANNKKLGTLADSAALDDAANKRSVQNYLKNFIQDGDADGAQILSVYNDSSTTRPVDGTGGTQANLAVSISSTSPLAGTNSFLFTKSGSTSTQGSGASIPFTIDSAYKAKVLQIEFDYIVNSGTFVAGSSTTDSDVIAYIYDVTNSQLIEPSSFKFLSNSSTISDKFIANFQTSATGTSYRLILHCATTSAANYELKLDNIKVAPCNYVYGTPITSWKAITGVNLFGATNGLAFTNQTTTTYERIVGDSVQYRIRTVFSGTPATGTGKFYWSLPRSADTTKINMTSSSTIGHMSFIDSGTAFKENAYPYLDAVNRISVTSDGGVDRWDSTIPITWTTNDAIEIVTDPIPTVGLSSSSQISDGYDGRIIAARYTTSSQALGTGTVDTVILTSKDYDTTNSYSTSTGLWTCPRSGWYQITGTATTTSRSSNTWDLTNYIYVDSTNKKQNNTYTAAAGIVHLFPPQVSDILYITAGQTVSLRARAGYAGASLDGVAASNTLSIVGVNSPTTISATEKVIGSYTDSSNVSISTGNQILGFNATIEDTHGMKTGTGASTIFTIPEAGTYDIEVLLGCTATTTALNQYWIPKIYVDGVVVVEGGGRLPNGLDVPNGRARYTGPFNAGQVVTIRIDTNVGASRNLIASTQQNRLYISRIK